MRTELRSLLAPVRRISAAGLLLLAALTVLQFMPGGLSDANGQYLDNRLEYDLAFDQSWSYIVSRPGENRTRVIRRTQRHLKRFLVGELRTKSPHNVQKIIARGDTVAISGKVYVSEAPDVRAEPKSFIAIAENAVFRMVFLEGDRAPETCAESTRLLDVAQNGRLIVITERLDGFAGKCNVQRVTREIRSLGHDGSLEPLSTWQSSFGIFGSTDDEYEDGENGLGSRVLFANERYTATSFKGGELQMSSYDPARTVTLPYTFNKRTWEMSQGGKMISSRYGRRVPVTTLFDDPMNPVVGRPLNRPGMISYFHFCGDRIIEIARRGTHVYRDSDKRYWRVSLRDADGTWVKTFKKKLRRGTNFVGCDSLRARFHSLSWDEVRRFDRLPVVDLDKE